VFKRFLLFFNFLRCRIVDELWTDQNYVLKHLENSLVDEGSFLLSVPQAEHQIGRYRQFKKIAAEILENGYEGDIVEFGTWQGLGMILLSRAFEEKLLDRRIIGIDTFEGLPSSSTIWKKGQFGDTSLENVELNIHTFSGNSKNFFLIKGLFNDPQTHEQIYGLTSSVAMIHFDADLGTSTLDALQIAENYFIQRKHPLFLLFDDWGSHPDEVPDAFYRWLENAKHFYNFKETKIGSTKYTRQYRLDFLN
jgi:hypothetical protein